MHGNDYDVVLECEHRTKVGPEMPPEVGAEVYCWTCQKLRRIVRVVDAFKIRCQDCRMARTYGASRVAALVAASTHAGTRSHRVVVRHDDRIVARYGYEQEPTLFDKPGF